MSIEYGEYIRGRERYVNVINNSRIIAKHGGLKPDVFYPMVQMRDDEDEFPVADVVQLPKQKVKVCEEPGAEPEIMELHVEGDWGYKIIAEDGEAGG